MRILIAEDDIDIGEVLTKFLVGEHFKVLWVRSGLAAQEALTSENFDCLVLDLNLPGKTGFEVLAHLREYKRTLPVLIISAYGTPLERARGINLGADDYMAKPFELVEFIARLRSVMRRASGGAAVSLTFGCLTLQREAKEALVGKERLNLTLKEYNVLEALLLREGGIVRKNHLMNILSDITHGASPNLIEVYIHKLRRTLETYGFRILTIRGVGYSIERHVPENGIQETDFVAPK